MKLCCVPGCSVGYERTCGFTSFETVYIACDVSVRLLSQRVSSYVASIIMLCTGFVSQTRKLSVQCVVLGVSTVLYSADSTFRPLLHT